jgi:hypothetical protein
MALPALETSSAFKDEGALVPQPLPYQPLNQTLFRSVSPRIAHTQL